MRIPHIINGNTLLEYNPSPETLDLIGESNRKFKAEHFEFGDDFCPSLSDFAVRTIAQNFKNRPLLNELPCAARDYLLELLSLDLPLELVVPLINHEYYWEKRYIEHFGSVFGRKAKCWNWKALYLERHIQNIVENAQPQYKDEENMDDILDLCSPYVRRIVANQLQWWKPPLNMDPEEIPEFWPIMHINFQPIFQKLTLIVEIDIVFGMQKVGDEFEFNMFKISDQDCVNLGKAVNILENLKILRIRQSKLEPDQMRNLSQGLINNNTIEVLSLSNCSIGDEGALCLAKILQMHPKLRNLNLTNNGIRAKGALGIAFALMQPESCPLDVLNLRLNPLEHEGSLAIMRAVVRLHKPMELSLSACQFGDETPLRVGGMLRVNQALRKLDVSSNWFGFEGGEAVLNGLLENETIEWIDLRETNIPEDLLAKINKKLAKNRFRDTAESVETTSTTQESFIKEEELNETEVDTASDETDLSESKATRKSEEDAYSDSSNESFYYQF